MEEKKFNIMKEILEWLICIAAALIISIAFKYYVGTPTMVKQPSMYPTLKENQRLWLNRWDRTRKILPEKGDIVTFEAPSTSVLTQEEIKENPIARYENQNKSIIEKFVYNVLEIKKVSYIKRVIGVPGDHVVIKDGKVYVNDSELTENYLRPGVITDNGRGNCIDVVVPENSIFVMGDNRTQSTDSRSFGCIPLEKIESKVWIRIWPLNQFGKIDKEN